VSRHFQSQGRYGDLRCWVFLEPFAVGPLSKHRQRASPVKARILEDWSELRHVIDPTRVQFYDEALGALLANRIPMAFARWAEQQTFCRAIKSAGRKCLR
jgi:hypothetical protein